MKQEVCGYAQLNERSSNLKQLLVIILKEVRYFK